MDQNRIVHKINDIEFYITYTRRRSIAISVLPDSSVVVRVPYRTSLNTIFRIVTGKYEWIKKHRDKYRESPSNAATIRYTNESLHLYRGLEKRLEIQYSVKQYISFNDDAIVAGLPDITDEKKVKKLLYKGYREEAERTFPGIIYRLLALYEGIGLVPSEIKIRTMRRRWGSCSAKGVITLSTELIKLPDIYLEYVFIHELCHLKHHNHGPHFYELLSELFPDWKKVRKELRNISH